MLNDIFDLSAFEFIPKRLLLVVSCYLGFLSLVMKRHTFAMAGELSGLDPSRFCALMNSEPTHQLSEKLLSRAVRRQLKKVKRIERRLVFIIDATIIARRSHDIENVGCYHNGQRHIWGHKFINFVVLSGEKVIPLASKPVYTKNYAQQLGCEHVTEPELVVQWLRSLEGGDFTKQQLKQAIFLLDSGYDAKAIQNTIDQIGSKFVMAVRSTRIINGKQVIKIFKDTQRYRNKTIRLHVGSGGKGSRRSYCVQEAYDVNLKGFGPISAISSKIQQSRKSPQKYIITNDAKMSAREIVKWYARRWHIEMWHRQMKQNYGFIDCKCKRIKAIESHINFSVSAYLLQQEKAEPQLRVEEFVRLRELREIRKEITKYGALTRLQTRLRAALQDKAA